MLHHLFYTSSSLHWLFVCGVSTFEGELCIMRERCADILPGDWLHLFLQGHEKKTLSRACGWYVVRGAFLCLSSVSSSSTWGWDNRPPHLQKRSQGWLSRSLKACLYIYLSMYTQPFHSFVLSSFSFCVFLCREDSDDVGVYHGYADGWTNWSLLSPLSILPRERQRPIHKDKKNEERWSLRSTFIRLTPHGDGEKEEISTREISTDRSTLDHSQWFSTPASTRTEAQLERDPRLDRCTYTSTPVTEQQKHKTHSMWKYTH